MEEKNAKIMKSVEKKIIYPGNGILPVFESGTKVIFHFQCHTLNSDGTMDQIIDDTKKNNCPMEIIFGKKFKMPVWEECIKTMQVGEVSQFKVKKKYVSAYPIIAKSYRQFAGLIKDETMHCCGIMAARDGLGQPDLDNLFLFPQDLQFTIELLKVENEYEKESWAMTCEEKLQSVPVLKETGNKLYNRKEYKKAAEKYAEALNRLEQLMLREKPGDEEWLKLEKLKFPLLLNYSQCKLMENDYYSVIENTSTVLEKNPNNVKALFRRAKAYVGAWDFEAAQKDFQTVMQLDPSLQKTVNKELINIASLQKQKDAEDAKFCGKVFKS